MKTKTKFWEVNEISADVIVGLGLWGFIIVAGTVLLIDILVK